MEERVQCAECGSTYDSTRDPFCPRCGSLKAGEPVALGPRADATRRRVHMAGLVLVLMGLAAAVPMGVTLAVPPEVDPAALESLAGSELVPRGDGGILVVDAHFAGSPVQLEAQVRAWNGTLVETVPVNGSARLQMPEAFANVTFRGVDGVWVRHIYAPAGKTAHLELNASAAPPGPEWVSTDLRPLVRITASLGLAAGLIVVAAGIAALRLRWFPVAVTGAAFALGGSLLLAVAVPLLVVNVLLSIVALLFIVRGSSRFKRG